MPDAKPTAFLSSSQTITGYYFRSKKDRVLLMQMNPAGKSYDSLLTALRESAVRGDSQSLHDITADSNDAVHKDEETRDFVVGEFPDIESARQWLRAEQSKSFG